MKVGFVTTCPKVPVGGVSVIYRFAEMAREMGLDSCVLASDPSFKPWWMDPPPKVSTKPLETEVDLAVIPECSTGVFSKLRAFLKVFFVQNAGLIRDKHLYEGIQGVFAISTYVAKEVRKFYSGPIFEVNPYLIPSLYTIGKKKPKTVLMFARKKGASYAPLIAEKLRKVGFSPILVQKPLSEAEYRAVFSEADIYVHCSFPEGFPMPPLEAMASGCIVVGWAGGGGRQFMRDEETALVVEDGDVDGIVDKLINKSTDQRATEIRERGIFESRLWPRERTFEQLRRALFSILGGGYERYSSLMETIVRLEKQQAEELGKLLLRRYSPGSVIDLGCGPGIYLLPFKRVGCRVLGVDACPDAGGVLGEGEFMVADLTRPFHPPFRADLALCLEVGEHVPFGASQILVENCARCAQRIIWSAARPGQKGMDHQNCQWLDFWIRLFELVGFRYERGETESLKKEMVRCPGTVERKWLLWNGAVFARSFS